MLSSIKLKSKIEIEIINQFNVTFYNDDVFSFYGHGMGILPKGFEYKRALYTLGSDPFPAVDKVMPPDMAASVPVSYPGMVKAAAA